MSNREKAKNGNGGSVHSGASAKCLLTEPGVAKEDTF